MKYIIDALRSVKGKLNSMDMRMRNAYRSDYNTKATQRVNSKAFKSDTEYLIYVELNKFRTNVFKKNGNQWSLVKSYECSIGKPSTPTIKGTFKVGIKGPYFGVEHGYK